MFGWFDSESPLTADQRRWIDERFNTPELTTTPVVFVPHRARAQQVVRRVGAGIEPPIQVLILKPGHTDAPVAGGPIA